MAIHTKQLWKVGWSLHPSGKPTGGLSQGWKAFERDAGHQCAGTLRRCVRLWPESRGAMMIEWSLLPFSVKASLSIFTVIQKTNQNHSAACAWHVCTVHMCDTYVLTYPGLSICLSVCLPVCLSACTHARTHAYASVCVCVCDCKCDVYVIVSVMRACGVYVWCVCVVCMCAYMCMCVKLECTHLLSKSKKMRVKFVWTIPNNITSFTIMVLGNLL